MTTTQLPDTASPSPLEVDLAVLPKVSLHDHLDGGLRVGTVLDLAREAGVEVPADTVEGLAEWIAEHANGESLEKYLQVFALTTAVMQTREQLRRVAREFVEDLVADGVVYGEIRWAPEQHLAGGLSLDEAVEAVQAGLDEAVEAADAAGHVIRVGQLVTAMRHADRAQEIAELAVRHREAGVVGFDIAGAEAAVELARIELDNTVIRAPADGRLGQVGVRLGQYVTAGTALVSHVSPEVWVIANFRETELHGIRVGDRATFTVDAMQHRAFTGRVEAFSPATASEFSILASSNTTGNFTKIAQRLPLRISIDPGQEMAEYLTPGLSVVVTVDEGSGARERSADAGRAVMGAV